MVALYSSTKFCEHDFLVVFSSFLGDHRGCGSRVGIFSCDEEVLGGQIF